MQNLTQKDFATKICEKPQVVNEYESGKAVPNQVRTDLTLNLSTVELFSGRTIYVNNSIGPIVKQKLCTASKLWI